MKPRTMTGLVILFILLMVLFASVYTISEGQRGLLLRLGKIMVNPKTQQPLVIGPGLHFKLPFVTTLQRFDVRLRTMSVDSSRILTAEQKYVLVDYYAKWRIDNLPLYFKSTRGYSRQAEELLKQKINDMLRAAFGQRDVKDVISGERVDIMKLLKKQANRNAESLGIRVVDVRIVGIELPEQVRESVYQRMRTQREQVATKFRAEGQAQAESIRANTDREVAVMIAKAKTNAQQIRATGDLIASEVYNQAYAKDPSFYSFYRSLLAYQQVFDNKTTVMVLKPDSQFFKYFNFNTQHNTIHKATKNKS